MLSHWMPYGLGPRQCIGMRFAQIEMKACIVNLLLRFDIRPANASDAKAVDAMPSEEPVNVRSMLETRDPLVNPIAGIHSGPTLSPEGGVNVVLVARTPVEDNDVSTTAANLNTSLEDSISEAEHPAEFSMEDGIVGIRQCFNQVSFSESLFEYFSDSQDRLH